jgi:hypothetical protein
VNPNLNLTPDELQRLVHALSLHAQGSGKVKALEQAFDCRKGGSMLYQRASWLFDQAITTAGEQPRSDERSETLVLAQSEQQG